MQILITGRHVDVPDEIRNYIHDKLGKLVRFYDRIHDAEVIFDHESEQIRIEMILRADRRHTFLAQDSGPDAVVLIDVLVEKLERQLVKHKEKNRSRKGGQAADGGGMVDS